ELGDVLAVLPAYLSELLLDAHEERRLHRRVRARAGGVDDLLRAVDEARDARGDRGRVEAAEEVEAARLAERLQLLEVERRLRLQGLELGGDAGERDVPLVDDLELAADRLERVDGVHRDRREHR